VLQTILTPERTESRLQGYLEAWLQYAAVQY